MKKKYSCFRGRCGHDRI